MNSIFKVSLLTAAMALSGCGEAQDAKATETAPAAATQTELSKALEAAPDNKVAYAIGVSMGSHMASQIDAIVAQQTEAERPLDQQLIRDGIKDALAGTPALEDAQIEEILQAFQQEMQAVMMAKQEELQKQQAAAAEKEQAEGPKWLAEVAKKEGAIVTESGLVLFKLRDGDGVKPTAADTVEVHYRGTTRDGKQFDSSYDRGQTIEFPLSGVIAGWTEGLQLMDIGSKYELYIPSELGYGARGAGADIPPHAALKFEIELVSIPSQQADEQAQ
ncbi:FKBP-type peptidyl-prolyl cis-trans isomerase [Ferrimonas senticii]|uniref:FKBP-type peptidyl-prolyl cis-trans isomerase n=1 Tax=Ferrimonas senticii TaxID=394566 RepID=UPI0003FBCC1E|nr:FKBP-type peptidyl-prolyl cis-trans isomerase [Ferrimonas senticii]